jgi:hypothetical protein
MPLPADSPPLESPLVNDATLTGTTVGALELLCETESYLIVRASSDDGLVSTILTGTDL